MRKLNHPLAVVCFVLGNKTQEQFGRMVGVSGNYIKKIELGKRPIPDELMTSICVVCGMPPEYFHRARRVGRPGTISLKRRIAIAYLLTQAWIAGNEHYERDALSVLRERLIPALESRVESATRMKRAVAFLLALERWLRQAVKDFNLPPLREAERYTKGWSMSDAPETEELAIYFSAAGRAWYRQSPFVLPPLEKAPDFIRQATNFESWNALMDPHPRGKANPPRQRARKAKRQKGRA